MNDFKTRDDHEREQRYQEMQHDERQARRFDEPLHPRNLVGTWPPGSAAMFTPEWYAQVAAYEQAAREAVNIQ